MKASEAKSKTDTNIGVRLEPIFEAIQKAISHEQYTVNLEHHMINDHIKFNLEELGYTVVWRSGTLEWCVSWNKPTDEQWDRSGDR